MFNICKLRLTFAARFVNGIGTGILNAIVPVWATETAEHTSRGQFIAIEFTLNIFGVVLAYWLELYVNQSDLCDILSNVRQWPVFHRQRRVSLPLEIPHRIPDRLPPSSLCGCLVLPRVTSMARQSRPGGRGSLHSTASTWI